MSKTQVPAYTFLRVFFIGLQVNENSRSFFALLRKKNNYFQVIAQQEVFMGF